MKDKVGIAFIGTGFARKVQIPSFKLCSDAEIVSVASGSLENARAGAQEFGVGHFTDDWHESVSHPDVDLVCITTPPVLHREMTLFAIEQGKHILCEKPMAMNVSEAEEMASAAEHSSVIALIDHELRFLPGRKRAYQMVREGAIGKVRHAKYNFRASYRGNPDLPWNWWSDIDQGGGALGAIGSHIVDSLLWLLGTEIMDVACQLNTHVAERKDRNGAMKPVTADDEASMLFTFADSDLTENATGLAACSMSEPPEYVNRVELFGSTGSMRIDNLGELYLAGRNDSNWVRIDVAEAIEASPNENGFSYGFKYIASQLTRSIRDGNRAVDGAAKFADGVNVQRVLDAARESDATGRKIGVQNARSSSSIG